MSRARVNPFDQGTPERVLFDRYRRDVALAETSEKAAAIEMTTAKAARASAERYAAALRALGFGDKVEGQARLPNYASIGEGHD